MKHRPQADTSTWNRSKFLSFVVDRTNTSKPLQLVPCQMSQTLRLLLRYDSDTNTNKDPYHLCNFI